MIRCDYKCLNCGLETEQPFNESNFVGYCPVCEENGEDRIQLFKKIFRSPNIARVWHGHFDMSTGAYVTDYKKWKNLLADAGKERSDRLGMEHDFIEVDASDKVNLGVTEEGLASTHDRHVELGYKESKGKFVYPIT